MYCETRSVNVEDFFSQFFFLRFVANYAFYRGIANSPPQPFFSLSLSVASYSRCLYIFVPFFQIVFIEHTLKRGLKEKKERIF